MSSVSPTATIVSPAMASSAVAKDRQVALRRAPLGRCACERQDLSCRMD